MKPLLLKLFKEYLECDEVINDVTMRQDKGGGTFISISKILAADKWHLTKAGTSEPDLEAAEKVSEKRRDLKMRQAYYLIVNHLKQEKQLDDYNNDNWKGEPITDPTKSNHFELFNYLYGACEFAGIFTLDEFMKLQELTDEGGRTIGVKVIPQDKPDLLADAGVELPGEDEQ